MSVNQEEKKKFEVGGKREETGIERFKAWKITLIQYSIKGPEMTVVYSMGESVMEDGF